MPSSTLDPAHAVISDHLEQLRRRGYTVLPQLLPAGRITALRKVLEEVVDGMLGELHADGLLPDTRPDLPLERRFAIAGTHAERFGASWRGRVASQALFDLHHEPALLRVLERIFEDGVMGHAVWNVRPKLPDQGLTTVPWHQDSGYFGPLSAAHQIITAWIPLVSSHPENGGLQLAPGSHARGLLTHQQGLEQGHFLEVVDEAATAGAIDVHMEPGDVLLFGNLLLHRSLPNRSQGIRWSLDARFYGEADAGRDIGNWGMPEPWVIHSRKRPATSFEQWHAWAAAL